MNLDFADLSFIIVLVTFLFSLSMGTFDIKRMEWHHACIISIAISILMINYSTVNQQMIIMAITAIVICLSQYVYLQVEQYIGHMVKHLYIVDVGLALSGTTYIVLRFF